MDGRTVLVAASGSDAEPAVLLRGRDDMWLVQSLERPIGQRLSGLRPGQLGLPRERRALGGRLPAGAVAVEVVAAAGEHLHCAVGNGAWVVAVADAACDEFNAPVLYYDANGAILVPQLPTDCPRKPVTDTEVMCPGCGIVAWDEVILLGGECRSSSEDSSRVQPARVLVCRGCGHEERLGTGYVRLSDASRGSVPTRRHIPQNTLPVLAPFPIYMADGLAGRVVGTSQSSGNITRVTVTHNSDYGGQLSQLTVQTEPISGRVSLTNPATLARRALARGLVNPRTRQDCSDAALALLVGADRRNSHRVALGRPTSLRRITVGSQSVDLRYVEAEPFWAGIARTHAVQITLTGNGCTPDVRLRPFEEAK